MGVVLSFSPGRVVPTDPAFDDSRKSLAGEFLFNGHKLIVIANHFKSKSGDGPLFGRLQPAVQSTLPQRELQGQAINAFVDSILALDPFANVIVLGDLNDFHFSTALGFLEDGVLTNLMDQLPDEEKYTFIFDGNAQTLDHILVSDYLLNFGLPSFDIVHTNVEYGTGVAPSDHEPILARMTPMTPFMQILPFVPKDAPATSVR
jgi:predicted extracellular nuclease